MDTIDRYKHQADKLLANFMLAKKQLREEKEELVKAHQLTRDTEKAQQVLQQIAQTVQEGAHKRIGTIVTRCLEAIWGEESYEFRFRFERKRGKTEAQPLFIRNGKILEQPLREAGGGPIQVAALALRIANIVLTKPDKRRLLVADEPLAMLSEKNARKVKSMIEQLAEDLDIQIIMVTHSDTLRVGKILEII